MGLVLIKDPDATLGQVGTRGPWEGAWVRRGPQEGRGKGPRASLCKLQPYWRSPRAGLSDDMNPPM